MADGLDDVFGALDAIEAKMIGAATAAMQTIVDALASWAKAEHTYTDRTSDLTNSIRGFIAEITPEVINGYLTAGMDYGIWVETARAGKWAFLLPTLTRHEADILKILDDAMVSALK